MERNSDSIRREDFLNEDVIYKIIAENTTGICIDQLPDRCFIGLIYDEERLRN